MNKAGALALSTMVIGGGILYAVTAKAGTKTDSLDIRELNKEVADYYPDIDNETLMIYYQDMIDYPSDYNSEAITDMILTLSYRGFASESEILWSNFK